jgi:microcystin-dependent protein
MKKSYLSVLFLLSITSAFASGVPSSFTYEGKVLNSAGTAPLTSVISLTLSLYDPTGTCLLYQEQQANIDLSQTNGTFAVQVGSTVAAAKRTTKDQNLSMTSVFANNGQILATSTSNCTAGYTPAANDIRLLRVTVTNGGSTVTISPDLQINAVPNAMVAETLQGQTPTQLQVPVGMILPFTGATCPTGYLAADGTGYSSTTYNNLFAIMGYTYGGASGTFLTPNTGGLFLRGAGTQTLAGINYSASVGSYQNDQMQGHTHIDSGHNHIDGFAGVNGNASFGVASVGATGNVNSQGGSSTTSHAITSTSSANLGGPTNDGTNGTPRTGLETHPANVGVKYCVKY